MKKLLTTLTVITALSTSAMADNATATIHVSQGNQKIYKEIYGQFAEHLGSCIYGGLWVGENSQIPNINGYRKDADTTARGVWNFIFAVLGAGIITIILNSLGSQPGMENWALSVHFTTFNWIGAVLLWIICGPIALGTLLVAGRNLPAMDYGTIAYWEVPVAIFIGIVIFAEPMTINSWLGVLLICGGGAFPTVKAMLARKGTGSVDQKTLESVQAENQAEVETKDLP